MNNYYSKYLKYKKKYLSIIKNNIINANNLVPKNNLFKGGFSNDLGHMNIDDKNITLYAIGDIHGDFELFKYILTKLLNVADYDKQKNTFKWINKNIYLIFNGDLVDRGGRGTGNVVDIEKNDILIINSLIDLKEQALKTNSDIILMCGNHELMIFNQYFKYSTLDEQQKKNIVRGSDFSINYANNVLGLLRLNNLLFTHGGICKEMFNPINYNINFNTDDIISHINNLIRKWLKNDENFQLTQKEIQDMNTILQGQEASPMWCRTFGYKNENDDCASEIDEDVFNEIKKLQNIPEKYKNYLKMIIAHTVQNKGINPSCSKKVWRIDAGMSRAFDNHIKDYNDSNINRLKANYEEYENHRKIQVLQIKMDEDGLFTKFKIINSGYRTYNLLQDSESLDKYINK